MKFLHKNGLQLTCAIGIIATLLSCGKHSLNPKEVARENDKPENVESYSRFEIQGTSWLSFRDVPTLIQKYAKGRITLDYGCGAGRSTRFLNSLDLEVSGVDISEKMLKQAREKDKKSKYLLINSGEIPTAPESYDLIFSSHVFLVVPTKEEMSKILNEFRRVLKNEGTVIIVTGSEEMHSKNRNWLSYETNFLENDNVSSGALLKLRIKEVGAIFYDYNWTDKDYREIFKSSGFELLEKHTPLGIKEDGYAWDSETKFSPYAIYVLKKAEG